MIIKNKKISKIKMLRENGITMVSLVITIIIIIILASLTIAGILHGAGVIGEVEDTTNSYLLDEEERELKLDKLYTQLASNTNLDMTESELRDLVQQLVELEIEDVLSSQQDLKDLITKLVNSSVKNALEEQGKTNTELNNKIEELTTKLSDLSTQIDKKISDLNTKIDTKVSDLTKLIDTKVNAKATELTTQMDSKISTNNLNKIYPVGSVFITYSETNPGTYLGGTWSRVGVGRTLIGAGTNEGYTFTVGSGGTTVGATTNPLGQYFHTLTVSEMPSHSHSYYMDLFGEEYLFGRYVNPNDTSTSQGFGIDQKAGEFVTGRRNGTFAIKSNGGSQSHNNIQPYVVVYMWRRTA